MADVVKEPFYVHIYHPCIFYTIIPALLKRIMCTSTRSVSKRAVVKDCFHCRFQIIFYYTLCYAVSYRRYAQWSLPALFLGNKYRSYWWWKIATRCHTIPNLVQVASQIFIEHLN